MRPPSRISLSLLLLLGMAWGAPGSEAQNARPTKVSKSKPAKSVRGTVRTTSARRAPLRTKSSTLRVRNSARPVDKKAKSSSSPEVPAYAIKLRESLHKAIDANFEKFPNQAKALPKDRTLYHSIKESSHRELWKGKYKAEGTGMIGEWMVGGKYGGIWTTSEKVGMFGGEGWYSDKGQSAVRITLKKNSKFIDLEDPVQKQIYKDWKKLSGQDTKTSPKDLFQVLKGADGVPLAKRIGGIRAPTHGDFLVHMGVAGVIHYDAYGQGNPVLINPHAIEKVEF